METEEFENIFQNESSHYYYVDTHDLVVDLIKRYVGPSKKVKILDAGCGTGLLGIKLQSFGRVVGVDTDPIAVMYAKRRGLMTRRASLSRLPFQACVFDAVVCVDVLYHKQITNDVKVLRELCRVLKPGGTLILRVPALPWLLRAHDVYVHTRARYSKEELNNKLCQAKFVAINTFFVHGLFFLFALCVWGAEKLGRVAPSPASGIFRLPKLLNTTLLMMARVERGIFRFVKMPIGLGLVAVAQKPRR